MDLITHLLTGLFLFEMLFLTFPLSKSFDMSEDFRDQKRRLDALYDRFSDFEALP